MTRVRLALTGTLLLALAGCGGAKEPAKAPAPASDAPTAETSAKPEAKAAPAAAGPAELPASCEAKEGYCMPPASYVKKLCSGFHPEVALAMLGKGTPWTRGYLKMDVDAVNASGGVSSGDKLLFDEEVIILIRRKADTSGIQVSGGGDGFDVLRWDGTCATLSGEELTTKAPPKPKNAKLLWKDVPDAAQAKLLDDAAIAKINGNRKRECKGVTLGNVSDKCVKAVDQLSAAIVTYVRGGGAVPTPAAIP